MLFRSFTGYGLDVDGASITADKVKIPRKWDDSFSAFNGVVQQSGMDLARYKGKTVEKWTALIPAAIGTFASIPAQISLSVIPRAYPTAVAASALYTM